MNAIDKTFNDECTVSYSNNLTLIIRKLLVACYTFLLNIIIIISFIIDSYYKLFIK